MPQRINTPKLPFSTSLDIERNRQNDFWQYEKIPHGIIVKCDEEEITVLRTPNFVYRNIFGEGDIDDNEIILKQHYQIFLGDFDDNILTDENDFKLILNEFCA